MNNKIIVLALSAILLSACGKEEKKPVEAPAPSYETVALSKEKFSTEMRVPAELTGLKQVDLFAKVAGYVKELKVDIGSEVKKGQLLITLEAPELGSQVAAARSRYKAVESNYIASNDTYRRLLETSKVEGTISKNELAVAEARKNADYAAFQSAKSSFDEVSNIQGYLQIRAPFDGVVSARNVNLGAYVGPNGGATPVLSIQEQEKLRLSVFVPERYSGYLKQNDEVSFRLKSLPGQKFSAKIARMSGTLDSRLRSERIEMDVPNQSGKLKPGMVAEVLLPLNAPDSTVVVPKTAVVTSSEGVYVILVENGKSKRVQVEKGRELEDRMEIFGELPDGGKVLKIGSEEIVDGTPVGGK